MSVHYRGHVTAKTGFYVGDKASETQVIDENGMNTLGTSKTAVATAAPSATTLTAAQSGSTIAVSATGANVITLPTAAAGLQYRISVTASGAAATITPGTSDKMIIMDATGGAILTATSAVNLSTTIATPNSGAGIILTAINDSTWVSHAGMGGWAAT